MRFAVGATTLTLRSQAGDVRERMLESSPSYGSDVLLFATLVVTAGAPLFYSTGLRRDLVAALFYLASALLLPAAVAVSVWWARWGRPSRGVLLQVAATSVSYALPPAIAVVALCSLRMELGLLGLGLMVFVAAVVLSVSSAMFGLSNGSRLLTFLRVFAIVAVPVAVLGMMDTFAHGLLVMEIWCIPLPVMAGGAVGAARGLEYHALGQKSAEEDLEE